MLRRQCGNISASVNLVVWLTVQLVNLTGKIRRWRGFGFMRSQSHGQGLADVIHPA